jgi:hypothetical protein
MIAQDNLNLIERFTNLPIKVDSQYRLDSEGLRKVLEDDSTICVIVGYRMLQYLSNRSNQFRRSKHIADYIQFRCGTYFDCVVFTAYTVSPNDFLVVCEDHVDRIIFNRFL